MSRRFNRSTPKFGSLNDWRMRLRGTLLLHQGGLFTVSEVIFTQEGVKLKGAKWLPSRNKWINRTYAPEQCDFSLPTLGYVNTEKVFVDIGGSRGTKALAFYVSRTAGRQAKHGTYRRALTTNALHRGVSLQDQDLLQPIANKYPTYRDAVKKIFEGGEVETSMAFSRNFCVSCDALGSGRLEYRGRVVGVYDSYKKEMVMLPVFKYLQQMFERDAHITISDNKENNNVQAA